MKIFLSMAIALFALLLSLPLIQSATGWPADVPLRGVENTVSPPDFRWAAWWNGTLQTGVDAWLNQHVGLRGRLVRAAHQIRYSLFRELPRGGGTEMVLGRHGFLFEKSYVDAYRQPEPHPEQEAREISASVRRLQDLLAADGIAFLLVIAPSKAEIYPEFLPPEADAAGRPARRSNYENMIGFLRQDGVNLVDSHELFLEWKKSPDTPLLFAQGGTHWNHYGATRVISVVLDRLRELTGKDLPSVQVVGSETNDWIVGADNDLGKLANLWTDQKFAGPQIHPIREKNPGTYLPDVLFVCDSFGSRLTELMTSSKLYRHQDTYYYYARHTYWPHRRDPYFEMEQQKQDLLRELQGRDAVVIVEVEYYLPRIGFGFVEDMLKAYGARDAARAAPPSS